jgi:Tfp pilus assembly protein PilF
MQAVMLSLDVDLDAVDCLQIGYHLMQQAKTSKAIPFFHAALERDPKNADAYVNLARAYTTLKRPQDSIEPARKALEINPNHHGGHLNLGAALQLCLDLDGGREHIDQAIALNPPYAADCWAARAMGSQYRGDVRQAICEYAMAMSLEPQNDLWRMSLAMMLMLDGQWDKGLAHYEARLSRIKPFPTDAIAKFTHGPGDTLAGKRVLICEEQGAGDNIMFARYFSVLRAMHPTSEFTFLCADTMAGWMGQYAGPHFNVISPSMNYGGVWDVQIPMMSLPLYFHDRRVPFLIPPERPDGFPPNDPGPGVGFCWRGSKDHAHDMFRSMQFSAIRQIMDAVAAPNYAVCLQSDATQEEKDEFLFAPQLAMWHDTALAIKDLSLVVTVDTAVAHLAGTLGVPTIMLLPLITDWRWQMVVPTTPFYPSMKILRQTKLGDWVPVIEEAKEEIKQSCYTFQSQ